MPKKWPYAVSKAALVERVQKLKLEPGDVIVVKDVDTLRALGETKLPEVGFPVPLVFAPGGIQKLSRADLMNLLEQTEERDKSVLEPYQVSGPL